MGASYDTVEAALPLRMLNVAVATGPLVLLTLIARRLRFGWLTLAMPVLVGALAAASIFIPGLRFLAQLDEPQGDLALSIGVSSAQWGAEWRVLTASFALFLLTRKGS